MQLKYLLTVILAASVSLLNTQFSYAELTASNLDLASSKRVSRTDYQYTYRINANNTGNNVSGVSAIVSSSSSNTSIVEGNLSFTDITAGATVLSSDTFTIRHDRRFPFDPSALTFDFSFDEQNTNTDADGDGFTPADGDCDDTDETINPGAVDIPGNDIDENCDGVDAVVTTPPSISFLSPVGGVIVTVARPVINLNYGSVDNSIDPSTLVVSLRNNPQSLNCEASLASATCSPIIDLPQGENILVASIADSTGNTSSTEISFLVDTVIVPVSINTPSNLLITSADQIDVTGEIAGVVEEITVNGVEATRTGSSFEVTVPLREGKNMLVAVATKSSGLTSTDSIQVTRDIQPPVVRVTTPPNGFISANKTLPVAGLVNDIVNGGTTADVVVNGLEATVSTGSFMVPEITLNRGLNTITATATDAAGNISTHTITVTYQEPVGQRISILSGNGQFGTVNSPAAQSLVAQITDDVGNPVAGKIVEFIVTRNTGSLSTPNGSDSGRTLRVPTNGLGQASVSLTLGETAGQGNNRVIARAIGVVGEIEFCATSNPLEADKILGTEGLTQRGQVGEPAPRPLEALVVDVQGNPIAGIQVFFQVSKGDGNFDGESLKTVETGDDGVARVVYTVGQTPGVNSQLITASFEGQPIDVLPAKYVISAFQPGDPSETRFSGVVLDNALSPIPSARVFIPDSDVEGLTDEEGKFELAGVPVGHIHLRIDPSDSPRPETFPALEFETDTIAGQDNVLGQPILIPALDTENASTVGGNVDVVVTMEGVPGLELKVFANSVTFPDGSRVGPITISQVHLDKVPMPPPSGTFFMPPAWTIQPTGTKFDPPAQITIPNDGMFPGRQIDIFQFDHEINEFINIGPGTTSDDGFSITSDPGFGITRAGWGGCGQPQPPDECQRSCGSLNPNECQTVQSQDCPACPTLVAKPGDTVLSQQLSSTDCQTDTCGGAIPNDGETPDPSLDVFGDCNKYACSGGSPQLEPDDSDIKDDDAKCRMCSEGSLVTDTSKENSSCSDLPDQSCFVCQDGTCQRPDCDAAGVTGNITLAELDQVRQFQQRLRGGISGKIPYIRFTFNPSISGQVTIGEECCADCSDPEVKKGIYQEASGTVSIGVSADAGPQLPIPKIKRMYARFGYVLEVEIDIRAEITIGVAANVTGSAFGKVNETCESGCIGVRGSASIAPRGFAGAEINEFDIELKRNGSDAEFDIIEVKGTELSAELLLGSIGWEGETSRGFECPPPSCSYTLGEGKFVATANGGTIRIFNFNLFEVSGFEWEYQLWEGGGGSC